MKKYIKDWDELLGGALLVILVALIALNVVSRYVFNHVFNWAEELAVIAFVWCVFVGVAASYKNEGHIAIDIVTNFFPERVQIVLEIIVDVVILAMNIGITYLSVFLSISSINKPTPILRIPYIYINLSLTLGFGLMVIYGFMHIVRKVKFFRLKV